MSGHDASTAMCRVIGEGCWVHPSADVIGDVRLGARCWIGPGAR